MCRPEVQSFLIQLPGLLHHTVSSFPSHVGGSSSLADVEVRWGERVKNPYIKNALSDLSQKPSALMSSLALSSVFAVRSWKCFIVELLQDGFQAIVVAHLSEKFSSQITNLIVTVDGKSSSVAA